MRNHLILLFMLACGSVMAQKGPEIAIPYDAETQLYTYTEVVEVADQTPAALFMNAKAWLVGATGDTTSVEVVADTKLVDRGVVTASTTMNGGMGVKVPITYNVVYTITLEFREGRYRYAISKFNIGGDLTGATPGMALETYAKQHESMGMGKNRMIDHEEEFCAALDVEVKKLIESMKAGVKAPKKVADW